MLKLASNTPFCLQDNINPGAGMSAEELFRLAQEARDSTQPLPGTAISASFGGVVVALDNGVKGAFVFKCDRLLQASLKPPHLAAFPAHTLHAPHQAGREPILCTPRHNYLTIYSKASTVCTGQKEGANSSQQPSQHDVAPGVCTPPWPVRVLAIVIQILLYFLGDALRGLTA